ncbi:MAG TPA: MFS transporter [Vicinamibacteria bacterium]|nr:MFS transporter [Vicinamibacteria bacterium]
MSLFPLFLVSFIGTLGYSIVLPFLVTVVTKFGGNAVVYGVVGAAYSACQLIGAPVLGKWSDVYGRRKILLLSQLGTLASWIVFLIALSLPPIPVFRLDGSGGAFAMTLPLFVLFVARATDGLTGGNVSVANAYLADLTQESERNKQFGKMAVATNLGFIAGPMLAGLLGATEWEETLPVLAALSISLAASFVIWKLLPESSPCVLSKNPGKTEVRKIFGQEQRECFELESDGRVSFGQALRLEKVPFLLAIYFLIFLGFNFFYAAFPVHATTSLGWSVKELGLFFSFLGLTTVLVQGPLLSRLSPKLPESILVVAGGLILGVGFWLFTSESLVSLYAGAACFSLGNGLQWPSFLAVLSNAAGRRYQGAVQGFGGSVGSLASIVGLILGGVFYQTLGGTTFLISAAMFVTVSALSIRFFYSRS